jgi:hypothetical protein
MHSRPNTSKTFKRRPPSPDSFEPRGLVRLRGSSHSTLGEVPGSALGAMAIRSLDLAGGSTFVPRPSRDVLRQVGMSVVGQGIRHEHPAK